MWPSANTVQCVVGFKNEQCCYVVFHNLNRTFALSSNNELYYSKSRNGLTEVLTHTMHSNKEVLFVPSTSYPTVLSEPFFDQHFVTASLIKTRITKMLFKENLATSRSFQVNTFCYLFVFENNVQDLFPLIWILRKRCKNLTTKF